MQASNDIRYVANMHQARLMLEIASAQADEKAKAIIAAVLKVRWSSKLIIASIKRHLARWAHLAVPIFNSVTTYNGSSDVDGGVILQYGWDMFLKYAHLQHRRWANWRYRISPIPTNNGLQIPAMVTTHVQ